MPIGKYGQYIIEGSLGPVLPGEDERSAPFAFEGSKCRKDLALSLIMSPVTSPFLMEKTTMKHDFDQILCFMGTEKAFDFQAEVELCLGDEAEKHIINKASTVYIPKGLSHCPLNFKIIRKPIIFLDISLTTEYSRRVTKDGESRLLKGEEIIKSILED